MCLDGGAKRHAQNYGWCKADGDVEGKPLGARFTAKTDQGAQQTLPVDQYDGKDGAGLNGDFEYFCLVLTDGLIELEEPPGEDQMPCARDRQKLGQSFDHAHQGGLQK